MTHQSRAIILKLSIANLGLTIVVCHVQVHYKLPEQLDLTMLKETYIIENVM